MTKASCDGSALDCNKAIKEIRRLENRWEELKRLVSTSNSEDVLIDGPNHDNPYFTCDQRWGFDDALNWVEMKMEELEEK
jgi:hypothetical protein